MHSYGYQTVSLTDGKNINGYLCLYVKANLCYDYTEVLLPRTGHMKLKCIGGRETSLGEKGLLFVRLFKLFYC